MHIELITSVDDLNGTRYFEFFPGVFWGRHWSPESVYLYEPVFDLVAGVFRAQFPSFDHYGPPVTISGLQIKRLATALDEFAETLSHAESPEDVWEPRLLSFLDELADELDDWSAAKARLRSMLHDLSQWLRSVAARHEPVTILGM